MNFQSVRIITDDVDRLVAFYELVLGAPADRPAPVFAEFRTEAGALAIGSTVTVAAFGEHAPRPRANESVILEFLVSDVDAEFGRIKDKIAEVVMEPTTMPWGNRSALVRDPDGNLVNIFSRPNEG